MHHLEFEGPTEGPTECELDDTAADIQRGGRGNRERERKRHKNKGRRGTERKSLGRKGEGEVGTSQSHSRKRKGHMTNFYFTDSNEEAVGDSMKDHKERVLRSC